MPSKAKVKMGAKKAGFAALSARDNPYVRRIIEDEDLRENIVGGFLAARDAYRRMSNGKGAAKAMAEDKKVKKDLKQAAESLRAASEQLRGKPRSKCSCRGRCKCGYKRRRRKRVMMLVLVTGGLVLAFNESARKAVLDLIFGSEEEFQYTSTTTPTS